MHCQTAQCASLVLTSCAFVTLLNTENIRSKAGQTSEIYACSGDAKPCSVDNLNDFT